jgi:hypothetical protein
MPALPIDPTTPKRMVTQTKSKNRQPTTPT